MINESGLLTSIHWEWKW